MAMRQKNTNLQPSDAQMVYVLNGVRLLPHYLLKNMYVQPGHTNENPRKIFSGDELIRMGAKGVYLPLWTRANMTKEEVRDSLFKKVEPVTQTNQPSALFN